MGGDPSFAATSSGDALPAQLPPNNALTTMLLRKRLPGKVRLMFPFRLKICGEIKGRRRRERETSNATAVADEATGPAATRPIGAVSNANWREIKKWWSQAGSNR